MRNLILFIFLMVVCSNAFCFEEKYAFHDSDGILHIMTLNDSSTTPEEESVKIGFPSNGFVLLTELPTSKEDRKFWKLSGSKIVVDASKKQADINGKLNKQMQKDAVLQKLKISQEELDKLRGI